MKKRITDWWRGATIVALLLLMTFFTNHITYGQGNVTGWGYNGTSQLNTPAGLTSVAGIAAGYGHSVALKNDGTVVVWGYNGSGQANIPAGLTNVTAIAAGVYHTIALKSNGTVVGWGSNSFGQTSVPAGLTNVVAIAASGYYSIALKSDGTIVGWGDNGSGQISIPAGLTGVKAIAAGLGHVLALKNDGTVVGWGNNSDGQISIPAGLTGVKAIAAGDLHSVALKTDGTVVGWGYNGSGQISIPAGLANVTAVSAGNYHTVVLKSDGTVAAWGSNSYGQTNIPAGQAGVTAISAGNLHNLVIIGTASAPTLSLSQASWYPTAAGSTQNITVSSNAAWTASSNASWLTISPSSGSGNGSFLLTVAANTQEANRTTVVIVKTGSQTKYVFVTQNGIGGRVTAWGIGTDNAPETALTGVTAISAGAGNNLALKNNGTVVGWGDNSYGQSTAPVGLTGVVAVAAGQFHTLALKSDGTLVSWGRNIEGQTNIPAGLTGVVAITVGAFHSVAVKNDGTVVAWGYNGQGQTNVPVGLTGVIAVSTNGRHTVALKSDGTVVSWGWNSAGQNNIPIGLTGVVAIAAGFEHNVALKANGTVTAWGENEDGQTTIPAGLTNVTAITAGYSHTAVIKNDGTVTAWGQNEYGQTTIPAGLTNVTAISGGSTYNLVILPSCPTVTLSPSTLSNVTQGATYSATLSQTGLASATFSVTSGSLPAGLSLSSAGTLSGTPTVNGTFNFTVTATDGTCSGSKVYSFKICPVITDFGQSIGGTAPTKSGFTYKGSYNNKWYYLSNSTISWKNARTACQNASGNLVIINDAAENSYVSSLMSSGNYLLIGLNDEVSEGSWKWVDGTSLGSYTNWNSGEPNNSPSACSPGGTGEDFVQLATSTGKWNDTPDDWTVCGFTNPYAVLELPQIMSVSYPSSVAQGGVAKIKLYRPQPNIKYTLLSNGSPVSSQKTTSADTLIFSTGALTTVNTYTFLATDTVSGCSKTLNATMTISIICPTVTLSPSTLSAGTQGAAYSATLSQTGLSSATFSVTSGSLPAGLSLSSAGALSGTPTVNGTFNFTVTAADGTCSGSNAYSLVVNTVITPPGIVPDLIVGARATKVLWTLSPSDYDYVQIQCRLEGASWPPTSVSLATSQHVAYRYVEMLPSSNYNIRFRARSTSGQDWSAWETMNLTTSSTPTCSPISPVIVTPGGTGARFDWSSYTTNTYI
ncbi:Alpha-tubulin suppressor, partial [Flexibacter flexilis DSM 6793]